jgi:hypothetical protein
MAFNQTPAERQASHRAGRASRMESRIDKASRASIAEPMAQNYFRSGLAHIAGAALTADTAYWVYLGRAQKDIVVNTVKIFVTAGGTGAQVAEFAIATTDQAPNGASQVLTVVDIDAALSDLTTTGVKTPGAVMNFPLDSSTHFWVGLRTNMATTQPAAYGLTLDNSTGHVLSTATAGVLAVGSKYTGAIITASVAWQAPAIQVGLV